MRFGIGQFSRYRGATVTLAVGLLVFSADVLFRGFGHHLSGNLAHVEEIPEIIAVHGRAERPSLLLVGNSLTNDGIEATKLSSYIGPKSVAKVTPDATNLWDWQCLLDREVVDQGAVFPTIVIGFAWHQLSDQTAADPSRLGAFYCGFADLKRPGRIGLNSIDSIGEFATARMLRLYAVRATLRNRLMGALIPHYERFTQLANRRAGDSNARAEPTIHSYATLARLAERLASSGSRLVVVAMPVRDEYSIDPALIELAEEGVLSVLDYRHVPGIDQTSFKDSMHLNRAGQDLITRRLGTDLAMLVRTELGYVGSP